MGGGHVNLELVPENDLERVLKRISGGKTKFFKAFTTFLNSQVVLLVKDADPENPLAKKPLTVCGPDGKPLLALFSSPARAEPSRGRHPEYHATVLVPAWQVIYQLPADRGIVVNPGWTIGLHINPDHLRAYRKRFQLERD